ncbi:MAG: zinc ribbon domain-containing protein [Solirubrobacteraceae bacterium]
MNQTSGTPPAAGPAPTTPDSAAAAPGEQAEAPASGFGSRGRARRRARFLRKARELAYRDLGGLVFNLHRFGQRNDALVLAKLTTLGHIDAELRTIEAALGEREPVTVLREAGITACPRCAAIHSSEDHFCPNCGLSMSRHVDLPVAGAAAVPAPASALATPPSAADTPAPQPPPAPPTAPAAPPVTSTHIPVPAHQPPRAPTPPTSASTKSAQPAPTPAEKAKAPSPAGSSDKEEATEIIRPGAPGS